jgi:predicted secreted acid phosphatase
VYLGLKHKSNSYLLNLARQHFLQSVEAIKIGKSIKLNPPKELKLPKRNPKFKTIFLDLDETLIHCDEASSNYTVKLNFPIEGGGGIIQVHPL